MAKVAKTKHSGTYKNLVGATNYYKAVLQNLQNLQVPVNQVNNVCIKCSKYCNLQH